MGHRSGQAWRVNVELESTFHSRLHILVDLSQKKFIIWPDSKVLKVGMGFW